MDYPSLARALMHSAGFEIQISGKRKELLLSTFDRLFTETLTAGERSVRVGNVTLRLNLANPSERLLFYAPDNLLRSYRRSPLFSILCRLAGTPGLFVDIGANLGMYSLLARALGFETVLFEPEPLHYAFLIRNTEAIGRPVACALSDHSGTAGFFVSGSSNPGSSSLVMPEGGWQQSEYQRTVSVRLSTFDDALATLDIAADAIRLIKIDVEGNEERTVLGMQNYLASPSAAPIWCEVRGPSSGRGRNSVLSVTHFLEQFGYRPFRAEGQRLAPFDIAKGPTPQVFDLLYAIPKHHGQALQLPA
ncbi:MAG TPA: FkbM family methyltransferase [Candidatus Acidoferrum sp.]|nr:FkbM family methyltransferase [Candidatus Acidoferrum sp.]